MPITPPYAVDPPVVQARSARHFWLGMIALCVSIACALALGLAVLSATAAFAAGSGQDAAAQDSLPVPAGPRSYSGVITDSHCGAKHKPKLDKSPADCARACVRNGSRYVLVDGDRTYVLEGDARDLQRYAGERVTVHGLLAGETIRVSEIDAGAEAEEAR